MNRVRIVNFWAPHLGNGRGPKGGGITASVASPVVFPSDFLFPVVGPTVPVTAPVAPVSVSQPMGMSSAFTAVLVIGALAALGYALTR